MTKYVQNFLAVDVLDSALRGIQEYDPIAHLDVAIVPFEETMPAAIPKIADVLQEVLDWVESSGGRVHFYSAREEPSRPTPKKPAPRKVTNASLVEQLAALSAQVQSLQEQQKLMANVAASSDAVPIAPPGQHVGGPFAARLPSLSSGLGALNQSSKAAAMLVGPPPKTKPPGREGDQPGGLPEDEPKDIAAVSTDPLLAALSSQSTALTALVAHMTSSSDPMSDLATSGGGQLSLSSRGVARRERMQQELANRTSGYFLAVQQQIFKRMNPDKFQKLSRTLWTRVLR